MCTEGGFKHNYIKEEFIQRKPKRTGAGNSQRKKKYFECKICQ